MTRPDFESLLREELEQCHTEERALFERHRIAVERWPFADTRWLATAFVVAWNEAEIMYYNDMEGGFNTSPVTEDGKIAVYYCNQDSLQGALHGWGGQDR